jgi:molybdenum cofactor cytidylyltransferase
VLERRHTHALNRKKDIMEVDGTLAAIVLAAGRSERMGRKNKLLLEVGGRAVLTRVIGAFLEASVSDIIVVTGAESVRVCAVAARAGSSVRSVHNRAFQEGMASSIRCGVRAAGPHVGGYAICPGDLPLLTAETVRHLAEVFAAHRPPRIFRPTCHGRPGHPVLFGRSFRKELLALQGDQGAQKVLQRHVHTVQTVPVEDEGIFRDVDTPEAMRVLRARIRGALEGNEPERGNSP